MLTATRENEERITTAHRAKLAYVYIRQSTAGQVRQHQESTQLQYRLVGRATALGWPDDRIEVIDDDLGKSGISSDARYGFQRLIAEIGLGKAGLVLSLDASRLARNNRDWHQLLELCSLFGVFIADGERLYDPCAYHDRLLLGLSGIMSEAELHQIKVRLHQGERQKAARGELRLPLPAGLVHQPGGGIILNPDEEVQARLHFVFRKFLPPASRSRRVFQKTRDAFVAIAASPAAHSENARADFGRHLQRAQSISRQQHDSCAPNRFLRCIAVTQQTAQLLPVFGGNLDAFDLAHAARFARRTTFENLLLGAGH
jgi:DNA invertase Pin-like site-specific DNA recombinase